MIAPRIPGTFLAIGGAAALLAGFASGWQVRDWRCEAAEGKRLRAEAAAQDLTRAWIDFASTAYEKDRADAAPRHDSRAQAVRTIYRDRVVPGDCAVPDDARRLLDDAIVDANARAGGEPQAAVPAAAADAGAAGRP